MHNLQPAAPIPKHVDYQRSSQRFPTTPREVGENGTYETVAPSAVNLAIPRQRNSCYKFCEQCHPTLNLAN